MNHSLTEIRNKIYSAWKNLKWDLSPDPYNGGYTHISGCHSIRSAYETVSNLGLFENVVKPLKGSSLFESDADRIKTTVEESRIIDSNVTLLDKALEALKDALKLVQPEENPSSVNIKLPPVKDFDDLAKYSRDLHLAITQVLYLDGVNGSVEIKSVENGSVWLNVVVEGAISLALLGTLTWAGAVIYKKILEGRLMEQQLRGLTLRNDSLEDVLKAQKESLSQLIESEALHISSATFSENIPENVNRIKNSIELFAGLLDKGAEIHPAIGAPEEVSNLYPNMKALPLVESKIKQLQ